MSERVELAWISICGEEGDLCTRVELGTAEATGSSCMRIKWIGCWPGLAKLWYRGDVVSVLFVSLYGIALNVALLATFYWEAWLTPWTLRGLWVGLAASSIFSLIHVSMRWAGILGLEKSSHDHEGWFREAQESYLRGDYFEAEAVLQRIFSSGQADVEAALLMVSILRRTRRWVQALYCIDRLLLLEKASVWSLELHQERRKIQLAMSAAEKRTSDDPIKLISVG